MTIPGRDDKKSAEQPKALNMKVGHLGRVICLPLSLAAAQEESSGRWPQTTSGRYKIFKLKVDAGETLDNLGLHYWTLGELELNEDGTTNAVPILHGSALGSSEQFLNDNIAAELFNPG